MKHFLIQGPLRIVNLRGVINGERPLKIFPHNLELSSCKSVPSAVSILFSDLNVLKALQIKKA